LDEGNSSRTWMCQFAAAAYRRTPAILSGVLVFDGD
jgi:hypothetical protein